MLDTSYTDCTAAAPALSTSQEVEHRIIIFPLLSFPSLTRGTRGSRVGPCGLPDFRPRLCDADGARMSPLALCNNSCVLTSRRGRKLWDPIDPCLLARARTRVSRPTLAPGGGKFRQTKDLGFERHTLNLYTHSHSHIQLRPTTHTRRPYDSE